jgi:hypothetical protein
MRGVPDVFRTEVRVDHASLRAEADGGDITRYRVRLTDSVDERWIAAYRAVQADSTAFRRFRLEPDGSISFACRGVDGPAMVMDALERLERLVEVVNGTADGRR